MLLLIITAFHSRSLHLPSLQTSAVLIRNPKRKWHEDSSQDYFSLSTCRCHTLHLHSPQLSHMEKCKSTMKRTYCKTHTLARDLGTYIALEPTFAFSL